MYKKLCKNKMKVRAACARYHGTRATYIKVFEIKFYKKTGIFYASYKTTKECENKSNYGKYHVVELYLATEDRIEAKGEYEELCDL